MKTGTKIHTEHISLSNNDKLGLLSNLSTMITAGIPIFEAVNSLLDDSKGNQKKILETLRDDLTQGKHLYFTFAKFPKLFDKVTVNIIKASEEAGTLDIALKDLKNSIKKDMEFTDKIKNALVYPLVIMVVFVGVLLVILTFVIPKITTVFSRLRVELPLPTKILLFVSNTLLTYTIPLIAATVIFFVVLIFFYKTQKRLLLSLLSSFPLISILAREIDLTRFSRSLYLLLSSGIPINSALELTEDVVMKKEVKKTIVHSKEMVLAGKKLSEGFKDSKKIIPTIMIKITEAGERSGTLDKSMQEISEHLDYEVSQTLGRVTTLIEPIMLVLVGIMVGGMMLAIIAPIYGLIGQVGSR